MLSYQKELEPNGVKLHEYEKRVVGAVDACKSTGSLVLFSPSRVRALQEVMWYALYGTFLWLAVAMVVRKFGKPLAPQDSKAHKQSEEKNLAISSYQTAAGRQAMLGAFQVRFCTRQRH